MNFMRNDLRPLILALAAAATGFGISAVYRSGYEAGMLAGFHNLDDLTQQALNESVKEMQAGRGDPSAGMSGTLPSHPDNESSTLSGRKVSRIHSLRTDVVNSQ